MNGIKKSQYGFALFEGSNLGCPGVYSINGCDSQKFCDISELKLQHPDVTFVTSIAPSVFAIGLGSRQSWLRDANFFGAPIADIMFEIGLANSDPDCSVKLISEILTRALDIAKDRMSLDTTATSFSSMMSHATLGPRNAPLSREISSALLRLMSNVMLHAEIYSETCSLIRIPLKRVHQYSKVISAKIPNGSWSEVNVASHGNINKWATGNEKPILALIGISKVSKELMPLFRKEFHLGGVSWVTLPELEVYSEFAQVKIHKLFVGEEYSSTSSFDAPAPRINPFDYLSISSGLFFESFLSASCTTNGSDFASLTGFIRPAWMLALSRSVSLRESILMTIAGFKVPSFGIAHLSVAMPLDNKNNIFDYVQSRPLLSAPMGCQNGF